MLIIIGPPCNLPNGYNGGSPCWPYFYFDGMTLVEEAPLEDLILELQGHPCDDNLAIIAEGGTPDGTWQWYFNGIAILGETSEILEIPLAEYEPGTYTVQFSLNGECMRDSISLNWELPNPSTEEHYVCPGDTVLCAGQQFIEAGEFDVTLESYQGCDSLVTCQIISYPIVPITILHVAICDTGKINICGVDYTQNGIYTAICSSEFGCDSVVELHLNILEPESIINPPGQLDCDTTSFVILDGSASPTNPFPGGTTTYLWTGPPNGIFGSATDPVVQVKLPGTYCLEITFSSEGTSCRDSACVLVEQVIELPLNPTIQVRQ